MRICYQLFPVLNQYLLNHKAIIPVSEIVENIDMAKKEQKLDVSERREVQINCSLRKERVFVFFSWIMIWCGTLKYQRKEEQHFRLNQLTQVMAKLKSDYIMAPSVDMFYNIIYACFWYGDFKMTQHVYERMETLKVNPDARIKYLLFQKERKDNIEKSNSKPKKPEAQSENLKKAQAAGSLLISSSGSGKTMKQRAYDKKAQTAQSNSLLALIQEE